jgi:molybdopterin-guanine dinucleotide biosynthesis protein A
MGTDKGLININEKTWAQSAFDKLASCGITACVSINETQKAAYLNVFEEQSIVMDSFPIEGPLCGLLSIHNAFPFHDLLILACDMIDVQAELIQKLITQLRQHEGEHDIFVFQNEKNLEPLFGIYTREGLQKIADLYNLGQLEKWSMKYVLEISNTHITQLDKSEKEQLKNYNSLT